MKFLTKISPGASCPPGRRQVLRIMKLIIIFFTTFLLQASAATLYGQKITLQVRDQSLENVLKLIKQQSGYDYVADAATLEQAGRVSLRLREVSVTEALDAAFRGQGLTYALSDRLILVKVRELSLLDRVVAAWKAIDVTGRVMDEGGLPVPGATVQTKDGKLVTATDGEGRFVLKGVEENAVIVVSVIGYEKREIAAAANLGDIKMVMATSKLEEVKINAGFYSVTDRERTGNISKVTAETISKQPINNPLMALQGIVPGLQVTQQNGLPGGSFTVQIRGRNSINSGSDPLYIIDGVIYPSTRISLQNTSLILGTTGVSPLSLIDPNSIESIEILKDADATSIYGSRGANGVILITTKKGIAGDLKININVTQGISQVAHKLDLLNTEQYISMRKEAFKNDGLQPTQYDYDVNGTWDSHKYTDWQKELIGKNSKTTNAAFNISGGSSKNAFLIGGNYYDEGTVFPGDLGFKRISIHSSINLGNIDDRFSANLVTNFNHTSSKLTASDITQNIFLSPNAPDLNDQYGKLNWENNTVELNPYASLLQTSNAERDNLIGNLTVNYKILRGLNFKTSIGYNTIRSNENTKYPLASNPPLYGYTAAQRISYFGNSYNNNFTIEPVITYKTDIKNSAIDILIGGSYQSTTSQLTGISASNFPSDDLMDNIGSGATFTTSNTLSKYRYVAVFGRVNYKFLNRYIFNLTARRDGSSRFGPDKQFANFGAVGAAWIFSDESFFAKKIPFISFGKLRGSYGITGNDQISDYQFLQIWNVNTNGTYQATSTLSPATNAPNANFAWETNRKLEIALQLGFFNDRLNFEFSYYQNRSSNQILFSALPLSTGQGGVNVNLPANIQNTGFEFNSNVKIFDKGQFKWLANLNFTIPKNKLLSYPGLEISNNALNYQVGQPLSIIKTYNVSVNNQSGLYSFEDKNASGTRDNPDLYIVKFLGQYFYGGLQNSFKFKQFGIDFLLSFVKQNNKVSSLTGYSGYWESGIASNQISNVLQRWQQPGQTTTVQQFSTTFTNYLASQTARSQGNLSVVDASFIRLRNLSFTYNIPKKFLSPVKINSAVLSLQGQNLMTLTNYIGLDPESGGTKLPPLRTIMLGLNVTF
jgi:TonB-linked SusC/RagA family outer membrane protein